MVKKEPPRRPFGWQYREQVEEKPGKAVVEQPSEAVVDKPVNADNPGEPETALEVIPEEVIPAEVVLKAQTTPVAPDADAPLTSAAIEEFAAQVVPLQTGAPVTPLPKQSRVIKSEAK